MDATSQDRLTQVRRLNAWLLAYADDLERLAFELGPEEEHWAILLLYKADHVRTMTVPEGY